MANVRGVVLMALLVAGVGAASWLCWPRPPAAAGRSDVAHARWPLGFQPNQGQFAPDVDFAARGRGFSVALSGAEAKLVVPERHASRTFRMRFAGAHAVIGHGLDRQQTSSNYFHGRDRAQWRSSVPSYARVAFAQLYPGIDLVYYGNPERLEYDLVLQPGADPARVRLRFEDVDALRLDDHGDLEVVAGAATLHQAKPRVTQSGDRGERTIAAEYAIVGPREVAFRLGDYDRGRALRIDPVVESSTFAGGTWFDEGAAIAVDNTGAAYFTGRSSSVDYPVSASALQSAAATIPDVVVTKLDPTGRTILYSTYLGGAGADRGTAIAVDAAGAVYVVGATASADFPVTNAFQAANRGATIPATGCAGSGGDAFIAKIAPAGDALVYSTFLGGTDDDCARAVAIDAAGAAYVAGSTYSTNFPTANAAQPTPASGGGLIGDGFVAKLAPSGNSLVFSTYLGGAAQDDAYDLALDPGGAIYVGGDSNSAVFPMTTTRLGSGWGGFVAKYDPTGALGFSTLFGGTDGPSHVAALAADASGVLVGGATQATDFPVLAAFQPASGGRTNCVGIGCGDGFVMKLSPAGDVVLFSSYFGGTSDDIVSDVALGPNGEAVLVGATASIDLPVFNAFQPRNGGGYFGDGFVARLSAAGELLGSSYLGGGRTDGATGVALRSGSAYVVGTTNSTNFPVANPAQPTIGGATDVFVTKVSYGKDRALVAAITPQSGGDTGIVSVVIDGGGFLPGVTIKLTRPGELDVAGYGAMVGRGGSAITATFDLRGRARGAWSLVIANPNQPAATIDNAFTVVKARGPDVWADLISRPTLRTNREEIVTLVYGNRGDVDALMVPVVLAGIPPDATVRYDFEIRSPMQPPLLEHPINWSAAPSEFTTSTQKFEGFVVPVVPAGTTGTLRFRITFPSVGQVKLRGWANPPLLGAVALPTPLRDVSGAEEYLCDAAMLNQVGHFYNLFVPGCVSEVATWLASTVLFDFPLLIHSANEEGETPVFSIVQIVMGHYGMLVECALETSLEIAVPEFTLIEIVFGFLELGQACSPYLRELLLEIKAALDPNDKAGLQGVGATRQVPADAPLAYRVSFENEATATAPAQTVVVTDRLDPALDLNTLRLGAIVIANRVLQPPSRSTDFAGYLDLRSTQHVVVDVRVQLDAAARVLTWRLTAIDPATGAPPLDPNMGLLPPNTAPPSGEGSVSFTALAAADRPTGTTVANQATIVFDSNAPIDTPTWSNVLDRDPPTSALTPLRAKTAGPDIAVSWSGSDVGSGVRDVAIDVSADGGPFAFWDRASSHQFTYRGEIGHQYAFRIVARDLVGNTQTEAPATTSTEVVAGGGCGCHLGGSEPLAWPPVAVAVVLLGYIWLRRRSAQR
jgi:Beta-propeller repeat